MDTHTIILIHTQKHIYTIHSYIHRYSINVYQYTVYNIHTQYLHVFNTLEYFIHKYILYTLYHLYHIYICDIYKYIHVMYTYTCTTNIYIYCRSATLLSHRWHILWSPLASMPFGMRCTQWHVLNWKMRIRGVARSQLVEKLLPECLKYFVMI